MDLAPKQQASEAIRQAEAILIVTGQRPNIDQVSSVVALSMILRKFGKKVTAVMSDGVPASTQFIAQGQFEKDLTGLRDFIMQVDLTHGGEVDKLKYTIENGKLNVHISPYKGGFNPSDVTFAHGDYHYDLIVAMGVPSRDKLDRVFTSHPQLLNTPLLNLDYHRINNNWGAINLVDTNAATLSEMLVSLAESLQNGLLDPDISTAMLTGIIASTDRFTAAHTTAKAMTVAAQLMAGGARQPAIIKALYGSREGGQKNENRNAKPEKRHEQPKSQPQFVTNGQTPAVNNQPAPALEPVTPVPAPADPMPAPQWQPQGAQDPTPTFPDHDVKPAPAAEPVYVPEPQPQIEVPTAPAHNPLETPAQPEPATPSAPAAPQAPEADKSSEVAGEAVPSSAQLNPYA